uniref:Carbamoyl phosphate synthase small chain n=1 Tax=Alsidium seaforthii TaxID=2007182 RepID=A0A1Z1MDF3_9FLOR|nr:carbamoyl phosphate synthase small subunit [Bryothamnion seaforthii]ARW63845.1 carbamoyl phosphate synthase small subunit [Bryothamnion seaforthii]
MLNNLHTATLYLQDGTCYKGWSFFKLSIHIGEIVFNTGMTGYQEIFSDPSYCGQIVTFTYPEIGNTGLNKHDNESSFVHVKGIIAKNISSLSSNWRSKISLKEFLVLKNVPHIFGIDTRALTQRIRSSGVMSAAICNSNYDSDLVNFKKIVVLDQLDLVRKVTTKRIYYVSNKLSLSHSLFYYNEPPKLSINSYKIVVVDFGLKLNILKRLLSLGCELCVIPATFSYKNIIMQEPDGLLLSNGPGNPSRYQYAINTVKKLIYFASIPIFGICMGHQIINLALGAETFKLRFGHRGLNHPSGTKNYSEITSQNHGFAVRNKSLLDNELINILRINYLNLNDLTISSTCHKIQPIFSVQYHPEASPGPHDSGYLFNTFVKLINITRSVN